MLKPKCQRNSNLAIQKDNMVHFLFFQLFGFPKPLDSINRSACPKCFSSGVFAVLGFRKSRIFVTLEVKYRVCTCSLLVVDGKGPWQRTTPKKTIQCQNDSDRITISPLQQSYGLDQHVIQVSRLWCIIWYPYTPVRQMKKKASTSTENPEHVKILLLPVYFKNLETSIGFSPSVSIWICHWISTQLVFSQFAELLRGILCCSLASWKEPMAAKA